MNKTEAIERVDKIIDDFCQGMHQLKQSYNIEIDKLEKECKVLSDIENLQILNYLQAELVRHGKEFQ